MIVDKFGVRLFGVAGMAAFLAMTVPAAAEFQLGGYMGYNKSFNSDVHYNSGGEDFTLQNVPWLGLSFLGSGGAPYYGLRGTYWFQDKPNWGVMLDYNHAKVRADPDATVTYTGTPSGSDQVKNIFDTLEFTDGLNLLTLNAMYRAAPMGNFQPYFGAGIGASIPHVEVLRTGHASTDKTFEYQLAGVAAQVLAGVEVPLGHNMSMFGEYKLSYATNNTSLVTGGSLSTNLWTNHLLFGVSVNWGK